MVLSQITLLVVKTEVLGHFNLIYIALVYWEMKHFTDLQT